MAKFLTLGSNVLTALAVLGVCSLALAAPAQQVIVTGSGGGAATVTGGKLDVNATVSGGTSATATAAAPSYVEGSDDNLSMDLNGSLRVRADSGTYVSGAFASGSIASGAMVDLGAKADATCATATGTCSLIALIKYLNNVGIVPLGNTTMTGSVPVTIANNQSVVAGVGAGATGVGPPANSVSLGATASGATLGLLQALKTCDLHAKYDASDNGSITMVTGVSGRKVYICGYIMATGGTATNLKLREGSDANCASNAADLTPAYQLVANDKIGMTSVFWTGLAVSTNAYYVCINASAGNAHQAELWYTIQ